MRMRHMVIYCLSTSTIFFHIVINGMIFEKDKLLNVKCVLWFSLQTLYETFIILRRTEEIWSKIYIGLHVKLPLLLSDFNETWNFSTDFRKLLKSNFVKIRPMRAEVFRADGRKGRRTDRHNEACSLFFFFYSFANASKNSRPLRCSLTLTRLTWSMWWAPNNASRWQMRYNSVFEGLIVLRIQ
jgi:hypothetical protein